MKPEESIDVLRRRAKEIPGPEVALEALAKQAREVAGQMRELAARNRHSIAVRVVARDNKVRITVVGPQAPRYRQLIKRELERRIPDAKAEFRSQVTGKKTR